MNESGLNCNEQTHRLGKNPCFDKHVFIVCARPKSKAKIDKTCRYADILISLLNTFRDVFLADLSNGLPPLQEVDHLIKVLHGSKPV